MAGVSDKSFLGQGLGRPLAVDESQRALPASLIRCNDDGKLARARFEEAVRLSIWIILATAKGERVMRPDFGCDLAELVFSPINPATFGRVADVVRQALLQFETRIFVRDVRVAASQDGASLSIDVEYEVRATNNVFNLVYPFYLQGGA